MSAGTLYVVPVVNAMGPVTDPRHADLLNTWADVDRAVAKLFVEDYRRRHLDSSGSAVILSWFFVDWTGFTSNPVGRDFGEFTVYDHYRRAFGPLLDRFGDALYWMYNHPAASGVGNEWGLDWLQNTHYLDILSRYVIERGYFPPVVEVPTEKNDASHWLEQWFPFDFGNRNCADLDLGAREADGKASGAVIDWQGAPDDWSEYRPDPSDYRRPGNMRRTIFRLLDIRTRIYQLKESEIERAFERCRSGRSTVLAAYEHDFRDRADVIEELLLAPVARLAARYHDVQWRYATARDAARAVVGRVATNITLAAASDGKVVRITATTPPFGPTPFACVLDSSTGRYEHRPLAAVGDRVWQLDQASLPEQGILGLAAVDESGAVDVRRYRLAQGRLEPTS